jgi:hypothetical protein
MSKKQIKSTSEEAYKQKSTKHRVKEIKNKAGMSKRISSFSRKSCKTIKQNTEGIK